MHHLARLSPCLLLVACATGAGRPAPVAPPPAVLSVAEPGLVAAETLSPPPAPVPDRGPLLAAGLPASVREEAPMRAQPLPAAPVLRSLPAGTPLRVLGNLDNAAGRWLSVRVGDTVGWLPASQVDYAH